VRLWPTRREPNTQRQEVAQGHRTVDANASVSQPKPTVPVLQAVCRKKTTSACQDLPFGHCQKGPPYLRQTDFTGRLDRSWGWFRQRRRTRSLDRSNVATDWIYLVSLTGETVDNSRAPITLRGCSGSQRRGNRGGRSLDRPSHVDGSSGYSQHLLARNAGRTDLGWFSVVLCCGRSTRLTNFW
jgi:hypothetical protein